MKSKEIKLSIVLKILKRQEQSLDTPKPRYYALRFYANFCVTRFDHGPQFHEHIYENIIEKYTFYTLFTFLSAMFAQTESRCTHVQ